MSYNPDEFVRLKHFNEFAAQLNIKLDGGTDPKPARSVSAKFLRKTDDGSTTEFVNMPQDGVINIPLARLGQNYKFTLLVTTPLDIIPTIQNYNDSYTAAASAFYSFTIGGPLYYPDRKNKWEFVFLVNPWTQPPLTARTVTFNLHFDETDKYDVYDKTIIINITEE